MALKDKVVLGKLKISQWTGTKTDKEMTETITENSGAADGSCRFVKNLIPKEDLATIKENANEMRAFFKENSMPWLDGGMRIIPSKNLSDFSRHIENLKMEREMAVKDFINNYELCKERARQELGSLFNEDDYPEKADLETAFEVEFNIEPLPDANDFRLDQNVSEFEQEKFKKDLEQRFQEAEKKAVRDLWERLHKVVSKMNEKLSDKDAVFRNSLVSNVKEIVDLLPGLNFANDEDLNKVIEEVRNELCAYEPDDLRKDENKREDAAKKSQQILDKMSDFVGEKKEEETSEFKNAA